MHKALLGSSGSSLQPLFSLTDIYLCLISIKRMHLGTVISKAMPEFQKIITDNISD